MRSHLDDLSRKLTRRRELRVTTVAVPFAVYFVWFAARLSEPQVRVLLVGAAFAVALSNILGRWALRSRFGAASALLADGSPTALRRAKVILVGTPWWEAWSVALRWLVGLPFVLVAVWMLADVSGLQVLAFAAVLLMIIPYATFQAYLVAENVLAPVLAGPDLGPVRLSREEAVALPESTRRLWLAVGILALPVVTLAFLFALAATGTVQFTGLGLHLAAIGLLTALAMGLALLESDVGTRRSVSALVSGIDAVARGDFGARAAVGSTSELAYVAQRVEDLSANVRGLLGELSRMSREQEAGDLDAAVDAAPFPGAYREIAQGVNAMVQSHVAMNRRGMQTVAEFARGNFDATLEAFPGKKRYVNEIVEQVRANLKGLVDELTRVTGAQAAGDSDAAIDAGRFAGGFGAIAQGVNGMAADQLTLTRKLLECVDQFGKGNFEAQLEPFPGKRAVVNETVERVRARLRAVIADVDRLSVAAAEGRTGVRADPSAHDGDYRRIVQGVNDTLDALLRPVLDVKRMLDAQAGGRLSARVDASAYRHEARTLAEAVNAAVSALLAPVEEATQALELLAQRDLRARMHGDYPGDLARLKDALNGTATALHDAIAQVSAAADQVSSASQQIASSSQAVAGGASEQASALEETSASLEAVLALTREATGHAQQANALAAAARGAAVEGAAVVEQMQGAMGKIRQSAEGTSQIIRDINDIAFQTNLLALNAAVEAARAGEAGRGFAVVAEEVRSLALRAKEAATRTEELIRQSVKEAGQGEVTARHVSGKLGEIVGGIAKVGDIVSEMARAAREQASGIDQVNRAVGEMDKVTQQNAASAEESSSAASELNGQAEELAVMVAAFRLERETSHSGRRSLGPGDGR